MKLNALCEKKTLSKIKNEKYRKIKTLKSF